MRACVGAGLSCRTRATYSSHHPLWRLARVNWAAQLPTRRSLSSLVVANSDALVLHQELLVEVRPVKDKGKGLFVKDSVETGTLLFIEEPTISRVCDNATVSGNAASEGGEAAPLRTDAPHLCATCYEPLKSSEGVEHSTMEEAVRAAAFKATKHKASPGDTTQDIWDSTIETAEGIIRKLNIDVVAMADTPLPALPCRNACGAVHYCSEECEDKGWVRTHKVLCGRETQVKSCQNFADKKDWFEISLLIPMLAHVHIHALTLVRGGECGADTVWPMFSRRLKENFAFVNWSVINANNASRSLKDLDRLHAHLLDIFSPHYKPDTVDEGMPNEASHLTPVPLELVDQLLGVLASNTQVHSNPPNTSHQTPTSHEHTHGNHLNRQFLQAYLSILRNPVDRYFLRAAGLNEDEAAEAFEAPWSALEPLAAFFDPLRCVGLFSIHSKINHSCEPNAFVVGYCMESVLPIVSSLVDQDGSIGEETIRQAGNSIAVVAKRDLEAGEEVTISYLGHMGDQPVSERRKFLRDRYGFVCDCALCQNEVPDAVVEE